MKSRMLMPSLILSAMFLLVAPIFGHHSAAAFWEMDKNVSVTGVLKSVKIVNPHPEMVVEVTEANGQKVEYLAVLASSGTIMRGLGFTNETFKPGITVTLDGKPAKSGAKALFAFAITTPDGKRRTFTIQ